ncbi:hypothetical protein Tco_1028416 [Tanacetum coccineum]|uniref:Homing endonuclease LAGLIDADG domain-containing protein n=1 Tax=Tanacetum coccineum TaxID=301880 RepID=A0ABQ5G0V8_9ASTR
MQDKNIAISELKKLIEMFKRKGVDTNFNNHLSWENRLYNQSEINQWYSLKYRYIVQSYKGRTQSLVAEKTDISENRASRNFDLMINKMASAENNTSGRPQFLALELNSISRRMNSGPGMQMVTRKKHFGGNIVPWLIELYVGIKDEQKLHCIVFRRDSSIVALSASCAQVMWMRTQRHNVYGCSLLQQNTVDYCDFSGSHSNIMQPRTTLRTIAHL